MEVILSYDDKSPQFSGLSKAEQEAFKRGVPHTIKIPKEWAEIHIPVFPRDEWNLCYPDTPADPESAGVKLAVFRLERRLEPGKPSVYRWTGTLD